MKAKGTQQCQTFFSFMLTKNGCDIKAVAEEARARESSARKQFKVCKILLHKMRIIILARQIVLSRIGVLSASNITAAANVLEGECSTVNKF